MARLPETIDQSLLPMRDRDCTAKVDPPCEKKCYSRNLCRKHYEESKTRPKECLKPGCRKNQETSEANFCQGHNDRLERAFAKGYARGYITPCKTKDCDKEPLLNNPYCLTCFNRHKRHTEAQIKKEDESNAREDRRQIYEKSIDFVSTNPGQDRIDWVHANLMQAERSQRFEYQQYQVDFINEAYRVESGKRKHNTAFFSSGRKNGKTTGISGLSVAEIHGPWAQAWKIPVASTGKDAAGTVYEQAKKMAENGGLLAEPGNRKTGIRFSDTRKTLTSNETGAQLHCLASDDVNTLSFIPGGIIIVDELGQHKNRKLYDSMDTSRGAHNPLMMVIGTRGPSNSVFNRRIRTLQEHPIETAFLHLYSADGDAEDFDPFSEKEWYAANPGLGTVLQKQVLIDAFAEARYDEEKLQGLIKFQLNVETDIGLQLEPFINAQIWKLCNHTPILEGPCYLGIDLAETTDFVSFAFYFPETGGLLNVSYVSEIPSLDDRIRTDHMDYNKVPRDLLKLCGRRVIDFHKLADEYIKWTQTFKVARVGADPWRLKRLLDALEDRNHVPGEQGNPEMVEIKQDFHDMGDCIIGLDRAFRAGYVCHGGNPLLGRACAVVRIAKDGANNKKFMKNKSFGRIDPLVASAMAYGVSEREGDIGTLLKHHKVEEKTTTVYGV